MRSIAARIVLSFLALSLAADLLLVWGAARQARHAAEERALQQSKTVAGLMRGWGPEVMDRVKNVVGADLVEVLAGRVRNTTLPREKAEQAAKTARVDTPFAEFGEYRLVAIAEGDTTVVFAFPAAQLEAAKKEAVRPLWPFAAGAIAGVVLVGIVLAATLLRPLRSLLAGAERVAGGDLTREVPAAGGKELEALAQAFNRMQEALRRQRDDERWAAAGRVAAGIAHDLRNPLTGMQMMVQMLERDENDARRRETLAQVLQEIRRLERSTAELMALAAPEAPRQEPVDLAAVAREALVLFEGRASHRGVTLDRREDGEAIFRGDPGRVRRILDNLVSNALDATPGGGRVTVTTGARNGRPALVVADTGPGISDAIRARLFESFASDKAGGTGLGLATVKRLADECGATVDVQTGPSGTMFTVAFTSR